jgi:hypothetical protein
MLRRRAFWLVALGLLGAAGVYFVAFRGIVVRLPKVASSLKPYSEELPGFHITSAPFSASADRRYLAFDTEAARSFRTINVWDSRNERLAAVVSIQESDPGSGASHAVAWSGDSRALLIFGRGRLPFETEGPLCLVYVPEAAALYRITPCVSERAAEQ